MGILRSEEMKQGTLILPAGNARSFLSALGRRKFLEFEDMNARSLKRNYRKHVNRIEGVERMIRQIMEQLSSSKPELCDISLEDFNLDGFLDRGDVFKLDALETEVAGIYGQFMQFKENNEKLAFERRAARDERCVMSTAVRLMDPSRGEGSSSELMPLGAHGSAMPGGTPMSSSRMTGSGLIHFHDLLSEVTTEPGLPPSVQFTSLSGLVSRTESDRLLRLLGRVTRGNVYIELHPIVLPGDTSEGRGQGTTGTSGSLAKSAERADLEEFCESHVVWLVYFQGGSESAMHGKVSGVVRGLGLEPYTWPTSLVVARKREKELQELIRDKDRALAGYTRFIEEECERLMVSRNSASLVLPDMPAMSSAFGSSSSGLAISASVEATLGARVPSGSYTYSGSGGYPVLADGSSVGIPLIVEWVAFLAQEKSLYATLDLFEGETTLRCVCWLPASMEHEIQLMLHNISRSEKMSALLITRPVPLPDMDGHESHEQEHSGDDSSSEPPMGEPRTYIRTNDVLRPAQEVIDTYGVPRYMELNPAVFTAVSFPFLFGVMFGDVGHGSLILLFAIYLVTRGDRLEAKGKDVVPMIKSFFPYRYLVLAMGFFSVFAGLMYGEFFGLPLDLFGSRWDCPLDESRTDSASSVQCAPNYDDANSSSSSLSGPYPFGIDPAWSVSTNGLLFSNSLKMKLSVLLGVCQMLLGLALRFANALHFKSMINLVCECIPMTLFLVSSFGYMCLLVQYKWVHASSNTPGIINTMTNMFLTGGQVQEGSEIFPGQEAFQKFLLLIMAISVPMIFIPKPILLYMKSSQPETVDSLSQRVNSFSTWVRGRFTSQRGTTDRAASDGSRRDGSSPGWQPEFEQLVDDSESGNEGSRHRGARGHSPSSREVAHGGFSFGDAMIHQMIETIEFVLGTVSHTASYLRLWALSLAHQQLSMVFLQKTLFAAMSIDEPFVIVAPAIMFAFVVFLQATLVILLGMDALECFLHTLRLHWVEFQSKFYKGDGKSFAPYSHENAILASEVLKPSQSGGNGGGHKNQKFQQPPLN